MKNLFTLILTAYFILGPLPHASWSSSVGAQTYVSVQLQDTVTRSQLSILAGPYDVVNYKVLYRTTDTQGQPDTASGLLVVPVNPSVELPLTVYMHGTVTNPEAVPSRLNVPERGLVDLLASQGYFAVAPDYLGLGDNDGFHPYVHAASEASAGRDLILAARQWLEEQSQSLNEQLFITGYSQGGHAAQALHRDIQENPGDDDLTVTAGAHLSGPYSISDVMRETIFQEELSTLPGYIVYTYASYDNVYGIFDSLGQVFVQPYLDVIEDYNDGDIDGGAFNSELSALLDEREERLEDMFQDSIRQQLADNDPDSRIVQALRDNDTYQWAPEAPTLIYYCTADEQVPFENSLVADSTMRALGSTSVVLQSGGERSHTGCVQPALLATLGFFEQFAARDSISTSVQRPVRMADLTLSPNPVVNGGSVMVHGLEQDAELSYILYDASGRRLQDGRIGTDRTIPLTATGAPGLYVLRVVLPDGNFAVRRLILR